MKHQVYNIQSGRVHDCYWIDPGDIVDVVYLDVYDIINLILDGKIVRDNIRMWADIETILSHSYGRTVGLVSQNAKKRKEEFGNEENTGGNILATPTMCTAMDDPQGAAEN